MNRQVKIGSFRDRSCPILRSACRRPIRTVSWQTQLQLLCLRKGNIALPSCPQPAPKGGWAMTPAPVESGSGALREALLFSISPGLKYRNFHLHMRKNSSLGGWLSTVAYSQVLNLQHLVTVVWKLEQIYWSPPSLSKAPGAILCLWPVLFMLAALTNYSPVDYFSSICSPGCFFSSRKKTGCEYASL